MMIDISVTTAKSARPLKSRAAAVLRAAVFAAAAICGIGVGARDASATAVTLGTASAYGLVVGSGTGTSSTQGITLNGGLNISGNVAVGNYGTVSLPSGSNSVSGNIYEGSNVTQTGSGSASISGSVNTSQNLTQVMADAVTASNAAANDAATSGLTATNGGSTTVAQNGTISITSSTTSLTIKALSAGENVFNISSLSLASGSLTFDDNGFSGAKFIINITGSNGLSVGSSGVIKGVNGATGTDVLFNVEKAGATVSITGNSTTAVIGTILAPAANVTIGGGGSLTGALIAGFNNAGKSYTTTEQSSGFNITSLGYKPSTVTKTPEPSTIFILGAGIFGLAVVRRRGAMRS